jgi:hypothetical protein
MPFYNTDRHPERTPERVIVDEMTRLLAHRKHWTKNALRRQRFLGLAKPSYCILGALEVADHPNGDIVHSPLTRPGVNVFNAINSVVATIYASRNMDMVDFNNAPTTNHADILNVLARVGEQLNAGWSDAA